MMKLFYLCLVFGVLVGYVACACTPYLCADDVPDGEPRVGRRCAVRRKSGQNFEATLSRFLKESLNDTEETIYMFPCYRYDLYCDTTTLATGDEAFCQELDDEFKSAPGDICESDQDCSGDNTCVSKVCKGKNEGEACTDVIECDPRLICEDGKCQKWKEIGEECTESTSCEIAATCFNNTCTQHLTMPDGTNIGYSDQVVCKSGYAMRAELEQGSLFCSSKGGSKHWSNSKQQTQGVCSVTYYYSDTGGKLEFNLPSRCGYNKDSSYYCPPFLFEGNTWINYSKVLAKTLIANRDLNCHKDSNFYKCSDARDKNLLDRVIKPIWKLTELDLYLENSGVSNADECILETINPIYADYRRLAGQATMYSLYSCVAILAFFMLYMI